MSKKIIVALIVCVINLSWISGLLLPFQPLASENEEKPRKDATKKRESAKAEKPKGEGQEDALQVAMERLEKIREKLRIAKGSDRTALEAEEKEQVERVAEILLDRWEKEGPPGLALLEGGEGDRLREIVRLHADLKSARAARDKQKSEVDNALTFINVNRKSIVESEAYTKFQRRSQGEMKKKLEALKNSAIDKNRPPPPPIPGMDANRHDTGADFLKSLLKMTKDSRERDSRYVAKWLVEQEKLTQIEIDLRYLEIEIHWRTEELPRIKQRMKDAWEKAIRGKDGPE